ncbi:conjugal transfer protein [Nonomuraea longicatena]|uniref:Conjugative transposon protein TcpC n=1 Tax=Nonomuraea longicatena TaxID=83682 RepID=A0ABP4AZW2_9ACTN
MANSAAPTPAGFPSDRASAFAAQFAGVYLNFNADDKATRAGKLAPFLPDASDQQFGWDGFGKLGAVGIQSYGVEVVDTQNAVASVIFQTGTRRLLLSVPVYYSGEEGRQFVVSGHPALLPAPSAAALPQVAAPERDDAAAGELKPQLEGFFKDYASGDTQGLQRYQAPDVELPNLGGALTFGQLKSVSVPVGGAAERVVEVVVEWVVPTGATPTADASAQEPSAVGGRLEQAYRLTVEKQGDKWYVKDIRGAGRAVG